MKFAKMLFVLMFAACLPALAQQDADPNDGPQQFMCCGQTAPFDGIPWFSEDGPPGPATQQQIIDFIGPNFALTPRGTPVVQVGLTDAMPSLTICDTSTTETPTYCPAGLYELILYVSPVAVGTGGTVQPVISFNDGADRGASIGTGVPLTASTPASFVYPLYHAAGTAITLSTSVAGMAGSPAYTVRARLVLIGS